MPSLSVGWFILSAICVVLVHWTSDFIVAVVVLTITMSVGNCGGIISTIAMEFFPTNINAMGMCFIMMIGRLGAVLGGNVMGQVLFGNCDAVFWFKFGIIILLGVLTMCLPERRVQRKAVENRNSAIID